MPVARFRQICLALPEAEESAFASHFVYKVRKKTFAMQLNNHHGDGRIAAWIKAEPGVQDALVQADSKRYFVPPYVGPKGWVGARLEKPDWKAVASLVKSAWALSAPKKLLEPRVPTK